MRIKQWNSWGYPEFYTDRESRWLSHFEDAECYEREMTQRDLRFQEQAEAWLHGMENLNPHEDIREIWSRWAQVDYQRLEPVPFTPKPSRDIRGEKTRDYRKKRPKAPRYKPDAAVSVGLVYCMFFA